MSELAEWERKVIEKLLEGDDERLSVLRSQLAGAGAASRENTGAGLYVILSTKLDARILRQKQPIRIDDVEADVPGLTHGAGFVLYIEKGRLTLLECYAYDEDWPDQVKQINLYFRGRGQRDEIALREDLKDSFVGHAESRKESEGATVTGTPRKEKATVFVVLRIDDFQVNVHGPESLKDAVSAVQVLPTLDEAMAEVERLNEVNAGKKARYFWLASRYYPHGRNRKGEW